MTYYPWQFLVSLSSTTTYREVLEEQITPIVLYIEEQAKDQNEKHGASKDEYIILNQIPGQIALILLFLIRLDSNLMKMTTIMPLSNDMRRPRRLSFIMSKRWSLVKYDFQGDYVRMFSCQRNSMLC